MTWYKMSAVWRSFAKNHQNPPEAIIPNNICLVHVRCRQRQDFATIKQRGKAVAYDLTECSFIVAFTYNR